MFSLTNTILKVLVVTKSYFESKTANPKTEEELMEWQIRLQKFIWLEHNLRYITEDTQKLKITLDFTRFF